MNCDFPENAVIMSREPLQGMEPADMKEWISEHKEQEDIAIAYAQVHNKSGWLGHELDEYSEQEYPKARKIYDEWYAIEKELISRIIVILEQINRETGTQYVTSGIGTYYIAKPFMEMHGFRDGAGWWVK